MDLGLQRQGLPDQALRLALTFTVIQKNFQRGWIRFYGAAEAADKLRREGLEDEAVLFLEEGRFWLPRMAYLRRSFAGMTSWPLVVTVEISVFMGSPAVEKYTLGKNVSQILSWSGNLLKKEEGKGFYTEVHRGTEAQRRGSRSLASLPSFLPSRLRVNRASGMTVFLGGVVSDERRVAELKFCYP